MGWHKLNQKLFDKILKKDEEQGSLSFFIVGKNGEKLVGYPFVDDYGVQAFDCGGENGWRMLLENVYLIWL